MKIKRNRNGQYSITEMTHDDLANLMFAAGTAESWYWQQPENGGEAGSPGWIRQRRGTFGRLERVLRAFYNDRRTAGTVEVVSDSYEARNDSRARAAYESPVPLEDDQPSPFEAIGLVMVDVS